MWKSPPQHLILDNTHVHLWMINIDDFKHRVYEYKAILSKDELDKSNKFYFNDAKDKYVINRGILRLILAYYLEIKAEEIVFFYQEKGKPFITPQIKKNTLHFNISHKHQYTIYAIANYNLGVDIEKIDDKVKVGDIAKRFFCYDEYEYLTNLKKEKQFLYFFQLWTIKEAYLKAIGDGLSGGLDNICFVIDENRIKLVKQLYDQILPDYWFFKTWDLANNYIMSLAINSLVEPKFYYYSYE